MSTPRSARPASSASARTSARSSRRFSRRGWSTSAGPSIPTTRASSRGGRRGATSASATSAGGSTTSWRAPRSRGERPPARCGRTWAPATTPRSWRISELPSRRPGRLPVPSASIAPQRQEKGGHPLRNRFILIGSVVALFAAFAAGVPTPDARIEQVENGLRPPVLVEGDKTWSIAERMKHYGVPGLSIAVIRDSKIEWAKGYGLSDVEEKKPVTPDTLFQAGSISKPVSAMAALELVQDGKMSLTADINTYLKTWKVPANEHTAKAPVTLERLLSHTAGLTVHGFPGYAAGAPVPTVPQVLDGAAPANTAPVRVDLDPGTQYRDSGGGYTIAQLAMTDVTGQTFPALMQRLVLGPLGMKESTFDQPLPAALVPAA